MSQTLDDIDSVSYSDEIIPFQFREDKSEEGTLKWLNEWFHFEYDRAFTRWTAYKRYMQMWKNNAKDGELDSTRLHRDRPNKAKKPKIKDNIVFSYTEQRVAQVSRKKTALAFIPRVQNSQQDINASEACKLLVRARYEAMDFDGRMINMDRTTFLLGHSLAEVCWDPQIGDLAPSYLKAKQKYGDNIPEIGEDGQPTGKIVKKPVRLGDVDVKVWKPYEFFPEPEKKCIEDCDYVVTFEWKFKQEVEAKYPKAKGKLEGSSLQRFRMDIDDYSTPNNMVLVRCFYHKPTEFFPEGAKILWCDEVILEDIDFPYNHGKLNFVEDKDMDLNDEFWARPFVVNIEQLYKVNNSVLSGMARNHGVLSAPKYIIAEGSVDTKNLHNDFGVIPFRGPQEPKVLQHNYVNRGEMDFQKFLNNRAGDLSGVFDISRGQVPPGITAAQAIRYLDEQEQQRANTSVSKRYRRVLDITRLVVATMSQYYKDSDERTVRLVGENNSYIIKSFNKLSLGSIADVRYQNTSSLGDTKTGAIADIIDLNASNQKDPVFGRKEIIKMLDLGLDDAFKDEATFAVDTARTMLEKILDGEEVQPPTSADGLAEFYHVFSRFVETLLYKTMLDPALKQAVDDYIMALEMLMWQQSVKNQKFAMILQNFEKFPIFFSVPQPPMPVMPGMEGAPSDMVGMETDKMEMNKKAVEQAVDSNTEQGV